MYCDEGEKRDGQGQDAPQRRFLWLSALAFCMFLGYIANVEVCASVAIQVTATVRFPVCIVSAGGLGGANFEQPMSLQASEMPSASVRPKVLGQRLGESH